MPNGWKVGGEFDGVELVAHAVPGDLTGAVANRPNLHVQQRQIHVDQIVEMRAKIAGISDRQITEQTRIVVGSIKFAQIDNSVRRYAPQFLLRRR